MDARPITPEMIDQDEAPEPQQTMPMSVKDRKLLEKQEKERIKKEKEQEKMRKKEEEKEKKRLEKEKKALLAAEKKAAKQKSKQKVIIECDFKSLYSFATQPRLLKKIRNFTFSHNVFYAIYPKGGYLDFSHLTKLKNIYTVNLSLRPPRKYD